MNKVSYFEFGSKDPARSARFFKKAFGWKIGSWTDKEWGPYWHMKGAGVMGGIYKNNRPEAIITISVASVDKTIARVKKLGGKVVEKRKELGDWGAYATLQAPGGPIFSIMEEY